MIAAKPAASTAAFTLTPGSGSASRAGPIGISGEAAMATPHATAAPAAAAKPTSTRPAASSWPRVIPSAASVRLSWAAASISRDATCPTTSSPVTARTSANTTSATACGRIDRSTVAACAASSATITWPPVAGKRRASAWARRLKPPSPAPGRSFT